MRLKIHIIYDIKGWAYYSTSKALIKYAPSDMKITHSNRLPRQIDEYDLIVILPFPKIKKFYARAKFYGVPVVTNLYIQLPLFLKEFEQSYEYTDYVIFNNQMSFEYFGKRANTCYAPQGCDQEIYYDEKKPRRNVALLCSSEHFRILKGVEIAKQIPSIEIHVTDSYHPSKSWGEMREWYNSAKVYVCLSEYDGTPTPALEAASCGCVVVSTPVGNMPELIRHGFNGFLLPNRDPAIVDHYIQNVITNFESYQQNMLEIIRNWSWENRSKLFYHFFRMMARNGGHFLSSSDTLQQ